MFIGYPTPRRVVPIRLIIPNLLTTIGLCSGLASVHFSLTGDWDRALMAVGIAAFFDLLDGRMARLLRATTPFGAVYDSLADFLSFGVAPAILLYQWMLLPQDVWGLAAMLVFVLCAALRLARFTAGVRLERMPVRAHGAVAGTSRFFVGLPTPAAAAAVLIWPMLAASRVRALQWHAPPWLVIVFTLLIAALMVSRLPMFSCRRFRVPRRMVVPLLVAAGLIVAMAARDLWLTVAVLTLGYLCTLPLSVWAYRRASARESGPGRVAPVEVREASALQDR